MPIPNDLMRSGDQTNCAASIISLAAQDQSSAVQYRFRLEGKRMFGMLVASHASGHSQAMLVPTDNGLHQELAIWDTLSDQALLDFEDTII